jgi:hypothetical protein
LSRTDKACLKLKINSCAVIVPHHRRFCQTFRELCDVWTSDVLWRLEVRIMFNSLANIVVFWTVSFHKLVFFFAGNERIENVDPSVKPSFSA